jgi:hypothetical protein
MPQAPLRFVRLNHNWNAHPNVAEFWHEINGPDLLFRFRLGQYLIPRFKWGDIGILRFINCSRFRIGDVNDEGWYAGQCRYGKLAPDWGEFYELTGDDPLRDQPSDWLAGGGASSSPRHFLFYLRDNTFECIADDWRIERTADNPLMRAIGWRATVGRSFSRLWRRG